MQRRRQPKVQKKTLSGSRRPLKPPSIYYWCRRHSPKRGGLESRQQLAAAALEAARGLPPAFSKRGGLASRRRLAAAALEAARGLPPGGKKGAANSDIEKPIVRPLSLQKSRYKLN